MGQVLDVMNGYLTVSPMVFVHAGFDIGKLLTSSTAWPTSTTETDETTWKKLLVLLTNAPSGTLKWYHQVSLVACLGLAIVVCGPVRVGV